MPGRTRRTEPKDFGGLLCCPAFGVFYMAADSTIERLQASDEVWVTTYQSRDPLFKQGDTTGSVGVFVICEGGLVVTRHVYREDESADKQPIPGSSQIVAFDTVGSVLGEVEFLIKAVPNEVMPRGFSATEAKATVEALTETSAITITGSAREVFFDDPQILRNVAKLLAIKLLRRSARDDAMILHRRNWKEVIASLLHRLAQPPERMGLGVDPLSDPPMDLFGFDQLRCKIPIDVLEEALDVGEQTIRRAFALLRDERIADFRNGVILISRNFVDKGSPQASW